MTYFGGFLGFPPSLLTKKKGAKGANIGGPRLDNTCIGRACTRDACTSNSYTKSACNGDASDKGSYIRRCYTVKRSGIHLQSF